MKGIVFTALLASLLLVMVHLPYGVGVDVCQDKRKRCETIMRTTSDRVTKAFESAEPDLPAILDQCQYSKKMLISCLDEMKGVCSDNISRTRESLLASYNSVCEQGYSVLQKCPQAMGCIYGQPDEGNEKCSFSGGLMGCLSGLGDTCQLDENRVAFKEVETRAELFCNEIDTELKSSSCPGLGECVLGSDLIKKLYGGDMGSYDIPSVQYSLLLDSAIWCQYLEVVADCFVHGTDNCQTTPSFLTFMRRQLSELKDICLSSAAGRVTAVTRDLTLVLLTAVFTAGARLFPWVPGA